MSSSKPTNSGMLQIFRFLTDDYMGLFKTVPEYFMAIDLYLQLLRFRCNIEKLSRRHFINFLSISPKFWIKLYFIFQAYPVQVRLDEVCRKEDVYNKWSQIL